AIPWGKEHFFPLLMPISWFLVVGGSVLYCVTQFGGRGYWVAIAAAVLTDMVMEPLMVNGFGYWIWAQPTEGFVAPLHNFWGWTWISAVAIVFLRMFTGRLLESRLYWVHSLPLVGFAFFLAVMGILYDQSFTAAAGSIWFILLVGLLLVHHRKFRPV
ncbi:MAG: carotenoid biosynthesis protein, partial [Fimbriimonadaceae bacterium]